LGAAASCAHSRALRSVCFGDLWDQGDRQQRCGVVFVFVLVLVFVRFVERAGASIIAWGLITAFLSPDA
jgi:hypothetical protein